MKKQRKLWKVKLEAGWHSAATTRTAIAWVEAPNIRAAIERGERWAKQELKWHARAIGAKQLGTIDA